jgi:hypothetical protein
LSITLLPTAAQLRTQVKRLAETSERIDVVVRRIDDPTLIGLLVAAAERGAEVHLSTTLDADTDPALIDRLVNAGVVVAEPGPVRRGRGTTTALGPGVMIFDNDTEWWTAAIVGAFTGEKDSLAATVLLATLAETDDFHDGSEATDAVLQVLRWCDAYVDTPADERARARHRKTWEAHHPEAVAGAQRTVEMKPDAARYASPLSWQQIRRCDWGTYWGALIETDRTRGPRLKDSLCGPAGWLLGLEASHAAYAAGPDRWRSDIVRDQLLGRTPSTSLFGRIESEAFASLLASDASFRTALHTAIDQCIADPRAESMQVALAPVVGIPGVGVPEISRILAVAAPDRFFSILGETMQLRLSNIVGFDLTGQGTGLQDQLTRYIDAVEMIAAFPWADEGSSERTSDHVREPDAWAKRVALLGCLVC